MIPTRSRHVVYEVPMKPLYNPGIVYAMQLLEASTSWTLWDAASLWELLLSWWRQVSTLISVKSELQILQYIDIYEWTGSSEGTALEGGRGMLHLKYHILMTSHSRAVSPRHRDMELTQYTVQPPLISYGGDDMLSMEQVRHSAYLHVQITSANFFNCWHIFPLSFHGHSYTILSPPS